MRARLLPPVLLAAALGGCGVPRSEPTDLERFDYSTLPNLRRSRLALEDRLAREREHVAALQQDLAKLRVDEEQTYAVYLQAEEEYQLLQSDLSGTEGDLAGARAELEQAEAELSAAKQELAQSRSSRETLYRDLAEALAQLTRLHGLHDEIESLRERLAVEAPVVPVEDPPAGEQAGPASGDGPAGDSPAGDGDTEPPSADDGAAEAEEESSPDSGADDGGEVEGGSGAGAPEAEGDTGDGSEGEGGAADDARDNAVGSESDGGDGGVATRPSRNRHAALVGPGPRRA